MSLLTLLLAAVLPGAAQDGGFNMAAMKKKAADGSPAPAASVASLQVVMNCASAPIPAEPSHDDEAPGPDNDAPDRAGYCSAKLKKNVAIDWSDLPEGKGSFYAKKVTVTFRLDPISLFVASSYRKTTDKYPGPMDEGCPYTVVAEHERSHAEAYSAIVAAQCAALQTDVYKLVADGKLPAPEHPAIVKEADQIPDIQASVGQAIREVVMRRNATALDCMDKDKAAKDSLASYCKVYKRCDPWTWGSGIPAACAGALPMPPAPPAYCLDPAAAPASPAP